MKTIEAMKKAMYFIDDIPEFSGAASADRADSVCNSLREAIKREEAHTVEPVRECWYESSTMRVCNKCGQVHDKATTHPTPAPSGEHGAMKPEKEQDYRRAIKKLQSQGFTVDNLLRYLNKIKEEVENKTQT